MFPTAVIGIIGFACAVGFSYESRMQRARRFVDLGKLTTEMQIKLSFGIGFALMPALIVLWIVCPQQDYLAWILAVVQIVIDVLYLLIMDIVCGKQVRRNNIMKQLPVIYKRNCALHEGSMTDYGFIKHELYLWYGVKYTTKEIENALNELNLDIKL